MKTLNKKLCVVLVILAMMVSFAVLTFSTTEDQGRTGEVLPPVGSFSADQLANSILTSSTLGLLVAANKSGAEAQFEVYTTPLQGFPTNESSYNVISTGKAFGIAGVATTFYSYSVGGGTSGTTGQYSHRNHYSYDIARLSLSLSVPPGATHLGFDWKFGTEEETTYTYRDWAKAIVTTSTGSTNILKLPDENPVDVYNASFFSNKITGSSVWPGPPYPSPNDVIYNAVTSIYTAIFDVSSYIGETITIDFWVGDENDSILDSALFIDNLNIYTCFEKSFMESTLVETLLGKKAILNNVQVSGDFESTLDFTNFEIVTITTGPFAGKGFSKGEWETTLEGTSYKGDWKGALFLKPQERKIYLKGMTSGEISATVEGYLTESVPESGTYDQYQATWKIGRLGTTITSAIVNLNGTLAYQESSEFPATELYILQTNIEGTISGHYSGPLSTVLTHLRVVEETNPYYGEGFSIISYTSESGSGEGFTYDKLVSPGRVELKGLFTSPLFGIVSATLDESKLPRTLFLRIERVDLGLPPAADLKVTIWGPGRVSPGQTVNYIVEYRNDGLKQAENTAVVMILPNLLSYVSSSKGGIYVSAHSPWSMAWPFQFVPPKAMGFESVTVQISPGLQQGQIIPVSAIPVVLPQPLPETPPFEPVVRPIVESILELRFLCNYNGNCDCDQGEFFLWCPEDCNPNDCKPEEPKVPYCGDGICDPSEQGWCTDCGGSSFGSEVAVAYDPNIKYGPEGNVSPGQKLDYKVEYENEGEGIAFGVYFTDTLDEDLDDSNLEIGPVISTKDGSVIAPAGTYNPSTRTVTWLVGEVGPGQGGYAEFSVNVRSDAPDGTEIINFATVYFPSVPEATKTNGIVSHIGLNQPPLAEANGPYEGDEGSTINFDASGSYDPDGQSLKYRWDFNNDGVWDTEWSVEQTASYTWGDDYTGIVKLEVSDGELADIDTAPVTVNNVAPTVGAISAPIAPVSVGASIIASATFSDPGLQDTHTAVWEWGDGSETNVTVTEGFWSVENTHVYTAAGIYTIQLILTDNDGGVGSAVYQYVVVYDPSAGFVTGGGWIDSPSGAYAPAPSLTGKANFGFVSKYNKGATVPTGETEFQFHVANLNFHSTIYDWLVIAGPKAQYKGSGTINCSGNYGFMLTANDGQVKGGGGVDKFRIKIWDKATGSITYDNQMGDAEDGNANCAIGGGSIVIHAK